MNNKKNFSTEVANIIITEGIQRDINPATIFDQVREILCNKLHLAHNTAKNNNVDILDALRYVVSNENTEHAMCRCSLSSLYASSMQSSITIPTPKKIHYSGDYTIVIWEDNTKTVVKCAEGQVYSEYTGFIAAFAKKAFGNNSQINKLIRDIGSTYEPKAKKTTQDNTEEATAESDVDIKNH